MGDSIEIALLVITIGVVVAAISLMIVVNHLAGIRMALDTIADRMTKADDLIIENLEDIVWQTSETKKRIDSIDERASQFSQNQLEKSVGELKDFLNENSVPLDKLNDCINIPHPR